MNETSRKLAKELFPRPAFAPISLEADRLASALSSNKRLSDALLVPEAVQQRKRIWELSSNLHCSIIGTCFSTAELRNLLVKLDVPGSASATDHDLHGKAVLLAGNRTGGAKHLQKALDRRHRAAVNQFDKAQSEEEVRGLWAEARARGDIPGAYWAALTHPKTGHDLTRHIFAEVHMLSHLVGAANRADVRRLSQLEADKTALEDKVAKQQERLREVILDRDTTIRNLNALLAERLSEQPAPNPDTERRALDKVIVDLKSQLTSEADQRLRAEARESTLQQDLARCETDRTLAQATAEKLQAELASAEQAISRLTTAEATEALGMDLAGIKLLYVGGKSNLVAPMSAITKKCSAVLLHHDGGMEASITLLPGLIARADVVIFPADCISHEATTVIKRTCRQTNKIYLPLRSAGLASFVAALHGLWQSSHEAQP